MILDQQKYMAISLYQDKGNVHLYHLEYMCLMQRYKDIFKNKDAYNVKC